MRTLYGFTELMRDGYLSVLFPNLGVYNLLEESRDKLGLVSVIHICRLSQSPAVGYKNRRYKRGFNALRPGHVRDFAFYIQGRGKAF